MSIRYVIHPGSDTYIDAEECVVIEVTDEVAEAVERGDVSIDDCTVERESSLGAILADLWDRPYTGN